MLLAIIGISEGRPREEVIDVLHSQIVTLEKDLAKDENALNWFNIASAAPISSLPAPSEPPSTPLPGAPFFIPFNPPSKDNTVIQDFNPPSTDATVIANILQDKFKG